MTGKTPMSKGQIDALRAAHRAHPQPLCAWQPEAADLHIGFLIALERRGFVTLEKSKGGAWKMAITDAGRAAHEERVSA